MKKQSKIILIASILIIVGLVIVTQQAVLFPQATVPFTIKTTPTSCSVTLNGPFGVVATKDSGTTGAVFNVNTGLYTATISKSGYITRTAICPVMSGGQVYTVTLLLSCTYTVRTTPTSCSVSIDDGTAIDSGSSGAVFTLAAGIHSLSVSKTGYVTKTSSVALSGGSSSSSVILAANAVTYSLTVKTTPASCSVTIGSTTKDSGSSGAVFTLAAGTYSISVSKTGYTAQTRSTALSAAKTETFTLSATPPPPPPPPTYYSYTVKTTPTSCSVTISGTAKDSGTTGAVFSLTSGTYSVSVAKTGYTTNTYSTSITAAKTDTITLALIPVNQKPIPPSFNYPPFYSNYIGDAQSFGVNAWDDDESEQLEYRMDWGEGWTGWAAFTNERNDAGWTKAEKTLSHTWTSPFSGNIQAQSRDDSGAESTIYLYPWTSSEKPRYDLTVKTTPGDCTVTVDGQGTQNSGSYGASFSNLQMGTYTVSASKSGYTSDSMTVNLQSTKTVTLELRLITYSLTVTTNPTGCSVTMSGNTKDSATTGAVFTGLLPNAYEVTISKQGYISKTEYVSISDASKVVPITLEQIKVKLRIITDPTNCDVTLAVKSNMVPIGTGETKNTGTTGALFTDLVAGTYTVQATKQYYQTATETVIITDVDASKTITLSRSAFDLTILTIPDTCDVTLDGVTRNSGTSGSLKYEKIAKGTHTISVSKQEYKVNTTTINLEKDDIIRIRLSGQTFFLTVNTMPNDCSISVTPNGGIKTSTNGIALFDLEKGTYTVTASKTGYAIETQAVVITTAPVSISFNLRPAHILTIMTEPPGCTVNVNGVGEKTSDAEGKAIFFNVEEKTYNITVTKKGYATLQSPVMVDKDATMTFSLEKGTVEKKTPGFEILTLLVSLGISIILLKKMKKHKNK